MNDVERGWFSRNVAKIKTEIPPFCPTVWEGGYSLPPGDVRSWWSVSLISYGTHRYWRWHCTKSSDCQVRVRGAPWNVYGVNVTKAVIGAYMWQWWLVHILWHLPYVFSSFCCLMNYYTVTFATCWYMGWVKILPVTFCVNLTVATVNFL